MRNINRICMDNQNTDRIVIHSAVFRNAVVGNRNVFRDGRVVCVNVFAVDKHRLRAYVVKYAAVNFGILNRFAQKQSTGCNVFKFTVFYFEVFSVFIRDARHRVICRLAVFALVAVIKSVCSEQNVFKRYSVRAVNVYHGFNL